MSPSAAASAIGGWQRSPDQPAFQDTGLTSVVWTGSRFLATSLGSDLELFDSADGRTWHRQPPFATTGRTSGPALVAAGPQGMVAVGGGNGGPLATWQSADGLTWSAAPDQPAFQMRDGAFESVNAVIATADGWLAVGGEHYHCVPRCLLRAVVLTSSDGLRWTRLADQPALRYADMTALTRGPSGYVAVGTVMIDPKHGEAGLRAAAWTSPDGRDWTISASPVFAVPAGWARAGPTDVELRAIARHGDRLVVLGDVRPTFASDETYTPPLAIAWWSDGHAWTPVRIGPFVEAFQTSIVDVPDGFLAITGTALDCATGMWASDDGRTWRCSSTDPVFQGFVIRGAAASPEVEALIGYSSADPVFGAAWTLALR
jgi:hypothetical protein